MLRPWVTVRDLSWGIVARSFDRYDSFEGTPRLQDLDTLSGMRDGVLAVRAGRPVTGTSTPDALGGDARKIVQACAR
jgi:hypothetical protein